MIVITVIAPKEEELFTCDSCELSYSSEDYSVLLDGKKLAYFSLEESGLPQASKEGIPARCLCHDCIYKLLLLEANGEEMKVKIVYLENEVYGVVTPNDDNGIGFL